MTRIENNGDTNRQYAEQLRQRMQESEKTRKADFAKIDEKRDEIVKKEEREMAATKKMQEEDRQEAQKETRNEKKGINLDAMA